MPFAVVPADGMTTDEEYRDYFRDLFRVLIKQPFDFAEAPRVEDLGTPGRWLYAWPSEADAVAFVPKLKAKKGRWVVREVESPSFGPLRPIEIRFAGPRFRMGFDLAPWVNFAIRARFPGSCQIQTVGISSGVDAVHGPIQDDYRRYARLILPILTGLELWQLEMFESFIVVDSVSEACVVPPTPLVPAMPRPVVTRELAEDTR